MPFSKTHTEKKTEQYPCLSYYCNAVPTGVTWNPSVELLEYQNTIQHEKPYLNLEEKYTVCAQYHKAS